MTSSNFDQVAFAHNTSDALLTMLELANSELPATIRVVCAKYNVTSGGYVYQAFPFFVTKPTRLPEELPSAQLSICNVDRKIVEAVRSVSTPIEVTMFSVLASTPNVVEDGPYTLKLRDVGYSYSVVTGKLTVDDIRSEPYPADLFDPSTAPGIF